MRLFNKIKCLAGILVLLGTAHSTTAQTACSSSLGANGTKVVFHSADTTSIWGNVSNDDSAAIQADGVVTFYGEMWTNTANSSIESAGALLLKSPRPAPYAASHAQSIDNSGNTVSLPCLVIDNANNITINDNTEIRDTLVFVAGKLVLNGNNLTIENNHTNAIQGYNESSFIVTGAGATGGYLVRNGVSTTTLAFPIGTSTSSYTPASIANAGAVDDFSVRVFDGVYRDGTSGVDESAGGVGKTWDVQEGVSGGSNVTMSLQHNTADEGASFDNAKSYVTHYIGTAPNTAGDTTSLSKWDLVFQANLVAGSATGSITSGAPIAGASVTTRSGFTSFSPFTKAGYANSAPLPVDLLYLDAAWVGENAEITWGTASEVNSSHFELYRSTDGGLTYEYQTTVASLSDNGMSTELLDYTQYDETAKNQAPEVIYYKLKQVDSDGAFEWFGPVLLDQRARDEEGSIALYPNPAVSEVNVLIKGATPKQGQVVITDVLGKKIIEVPYSREKDGRLVTIATDYLRTGIYYASYSGHISKFVVSKE